MAPGHTLPDVGLPDRRRLQAAAVGRCRSGPKRACGASSDLRTRFELGIRFVCSDMWKPYLKVMARRDLGRGPRARPLPLDEEMNEAIDEVRADEAQRLKQDGYEPVLKHSRWCLLKRPENLTNKQTVKLAELLRYNLQVGAGATCCARTFSGSGLPVARLGGQVSGRVVHPDDAFADGADEESGSELRNHGG